MPLCDEFFITRLILNRLRKNRSKINHSTWLFNVRLQKNTANYSKLLTIIVYYPENNVGSYKLTVFIGWLHLSETIIISHNDCNTREEVRPTSMLVTHLCDELCWWQLLDVNNPLLLPLVLQLLKLISPFNLDESLFPCLVGSSK